MAQENSSKFHIAMFPWFATGHMTPFLHLSNKLAEKGHKISFLLPNKAKLQLQHLNLHPSLITFHVLTVPNVEGIPPGTETASEIPIFHTGILATAMNLMRDQVKDLLVKLKPGIVFYDMADWIPDLANEIEFKTVNYIVVSASSIAIALVPARLPDGDRSLEDIDLSEPPAGYPSSSVKLRKHEAKCLSFISHEFGNGKTFYQRITTGLKNCDAIAIRTCKEVEQRLCDYIAKEYNKPVFLTGPVLPEPEPKTSTIEEPFGNWLNGFEKGKVVFCAFGSQLILERNQFQELVLGFEMTGFPFLVALKPPFGAETVEEALPEGFKERVIERGVVHGGWVDQSAILNHGSIGCFVNHCGFGSMWESLMSDCQIVIVPNLGDQILNARLLSDELKVGVEVQRDENGWFSKEDLCNAIKNVMDVDNEVGGLVKKNHKNWKDILTRPRFMDDYIENFIRSLDKL